MHQVGPQWGSPVREPFAAKDKGTIGEESAII